MAKFCTKCGKKLEDGQVCDCEKKGKTAKAEKKEEVVESATPTTSIDFNYYANSYIDIVKGLFVKPADTFKKHATSKNLGLGITAIVINCIITGIFLCSLVSQGANLFLQVSGMGSVSSLFGYQVDYLKVFFIGFAFMAVGFSMTALMLYVFGGAIMKSNMDIRKGFAVVGVAAVFTTITTLGLIVLNYINMGLMLIVLLVAGIFYLTHLYQGIASSSNIDDNRLAYVFIPAVVIATFVVVYILPKIFF